MYYFTYGPSCSDKADSAWGTASPYRDAHTGGGWASHASEIAYVFGNSFPCSASHASETEADSSDTCECNPMTEERYGEGSSLRLTTAMQQLWTSFAKTGEPRAAPELFTEGGDVAEQWPPCGPGASVGKSSDEPVLVLGASEIKIKRGLKDADCALMHEHVHETRGEGLPWVKGVGIALLCLGGMLAAIHRKLLPNHGLPGVEEKTPWPEPVTCEVTARYSTLASLVLGALMVFLPFLAPHGALPFSLTVCMASALLLRDPRVLVIVATLVFLFGSYWISELLIFSLVRRTPFFAPYYADKGIFNQDRLGTNIDMREVEEKRRFPCRAPQRWAWPTEITRQARQLDCG